MMKLGIIKTETQYRDYLAEVDRLVISDPEVTSVNGVRLELLAKLVEDYEKVKFSISVPDPIDKIRTDQNDRCSDRCLEHASLQHDGISSYLTRTQCPSRRRA